MDSTGVDIVRLYVANDGKLALEVTWWLLLIAILIGGGWIIWKAFRSRALRHFDLVSVDIKLGSIGKASFKPNIEDIQIAHKIWAELVTRKAALPIDPDHDVIVEIYDSWYTLFTRVRDLIGGIPSHLIRSEKSTQEIVRIATETLNKGLRPHLTRWQAEFRNWYTQHKDELAQKTPQALQKEFPEYQSLMQDMQMVNRRLIEYAGELKKIAHGIKSDS